MQLLREKSSCLSLTSYKSFDNENEAVQQGSEMMAAGAAWQGVDMLPTLESARVGEASEEFGRGQSARLSRRDTASAGADFGAWDDDSGYLVE